MCQCFICCDRFICISHHTLRHIMSVCSNLMYVWQSCKCVRECARMCCQSWLLYVSIHCHIQCLKLSVSVTHDGDDESTHVVMILWYIVLCVKLTWYCCLLLCAISKPCDLRQHWQINIWRDQSRWRRVLGTAKDLEVPGQHLGRGARLLVLTEVWCLVMTGRTRDFFHQGR